jgi:hypothetical protein
MLSTDCGDSVRGVLKFGLMVLPFGGAMDRTVDMGNASPQLADVDLELGSPDRRVSVVMVGDAVGAG